MSCSGFGAGCGKGNYKPSVFPAIDAGSFRQKVEIQTPFLLEDNQGGGLYQWSTIATAWARIETIDSGSYGSLVNRENWEEGQLRARNSYRITLRYGPTITTDMRIIYNGRDLEIQSVVNVDELNWVITLFCQEMGNGEPQN